MAIEETLIVKLIIDVQQSITAIDKLEKQFAGLSASIRTAFSSDSNKKAINDLTNEQKKLAESTKQVVKEQEKQKKAFDATKFPEGSYRQLNAQLKDLNNSFKLLSAADRQGIVGQRLVKDINKTKNALKGIDASIGDFQRNVGNYAGGLRGLFKGLNDNLKTIGLGGAIRSLPALFGAVSAGAQKALEAIRFLGETFNSSARTSRLLAEAQDDIVNSYIEERSELDSLFQAAQNENSTKEEKAAALTKINTIYGEYLPNQLTEKSSAEEIAAAYRLSNAAIIENIVQKQKAVLVEKAIKEAIDEGLAARKTQADQDVQLANLTAGNISLTNLFTAAYSASSNAIQQKGAETAKKTAANSKSFEESIRATLQGISDSGLNFSEALGKADEKQATAFEKTSQRKSELEAEIKNLIITGQDYSSQQAELGRLTKQLTSAEEKYAAATRFSENELERLNRRSGELTEQIKLSILANRDYSKQSAELEKVRQKLADVEEKFAEATKKSETALEALNNRQKELNDEIQNAIATGQPYGQQLNDLIDVTKSLTGINKEFQDVQNQINKELREFADGSLADYDERLKDLQDSLKNVDIQSQEYLDIQKEITTIETQRDTILKALAVDTDALAASQANLNSQLTDEQAQNEALQRAKEQLNAITSETEDGAAKILAIQKQLDADLKAIDDAALQRQLSNIDAEILKLEAQKQIELDVVGENATAKAGIEAQYQEKVTDLQLQGAVIQGQILKKEVEDSAVAQTEITTKTSEEAEKRKAIQQQVLDAIAQGVSMAFEAISAAEAKITERQLAQSDKDKEAALARAESFGASEETKLKISEEFDKKKAEIEEKAAERQKAIALSQAAIDIALSILKASASAPPPLNLPAIAIASILGAIQLAIIGSQKFAAGALFDMDVRQGGGTMFAKGAYLSSGAYHSQGGMPILNPFTGQKVAEIEKGEAIINKRNSRLFYNELSFINSFGNNGVRFPNAGKIDSTDGLKQSLKQKGIAYASGGTFQGFSSSMLKLQNGAVIAADIQREANASLTTNNSQSFILNLISQKLSTIDTTLKTGFAEIPSTTDELRKTAQILKDAINAG